MKKVKKAILISPNNEKIECFYWELENICKNICEKEENYQKFMDFQKDYTYFNPYFDFVMFELNYVLGNALCEEGLYVIHTKDSLFEVKTSMMESFEYQDFYHKDVPLYDVISRMTKCSDKELTIHTMKKRLETCMIDPNGMSMMSHSGIPSNERGSHMVTCRTVLNQMLIKNQKIVEHYFNSSYDVISYLERNMGFLRTTSRQEGSYVIGNKSTISEFLLSELEKRKSYHLQDIDDHCDILTEEYITRRR